MQLTFFTSGETKTPAMMAEWEKEKEKEKQAAAPPNPAAAETGPQPKVEESTEKPQTKGKKDEKDAPRLVLEEKKTDDKVAPRLVLEETKTHQKTEAPEQVQQQTPPAPTYTWDHADLSELNALPVFKAILQDLCFRRTTFKDATRFKAAYDKCLEDAFDIFYQNQCNKVSTHFLVYYALKVMWVTYSKFDFLFIASLTNHDCSRQ